MLSMNGDHGNLARILQQLTAHILLHARGFVATSILIAIIAGVYAISHLGVNTSTNEMFSRDLDWFQRFNTFRDEFPVLDRNVIVVLESSIPEEVDSAQLQLANRLKQNPDIFGAILALESSNFFIRNGLLYLSEEELEQLGDRIAAMQPITGRLSQEPHLAGFASLLADSVLQNTQSSAELDQAVSRITDVFNDSAIGMPDSISWQLMLGETDPQQLFRRVIVVVPELDFAGAEPRRLVLDGIRKQVAELELAASPSLSIRLSGGLALEQEELASVAEGIIQGAIATVLLVIVILIATFRSLRLLVASLLALFCGLSITAAFTALAIGYINLISVAFVVLYIGLGIDFAIHYCLRYRELMAQGHASLAALSEASADTGSALALCAITSSVGFLTFVPTSFSGVAELGLIAGFGMFASLFATLILLPALIAILGPPRNSMIQHTPPLFRFIGVWVSENIKLVRITIIVIALASLWWASAAEFDSNPVNLRDPDSESVATYRDLLADADAPPLTLNTLVAAAEVPAVANRIFSLEEVSQVRSIADLIPASQPEKISLLEDFTLFTGIPERIELQAPESVRDMRALRDAAQALRTSTSEEYIRLGQSIENWLEQVDVETAETELMELQNSILNNLAFTWNRIVDGLQPAPVEIADLPPDIQDLWISPGGAHRLEILSATPLMGIEDIGAFVAAVSSVQPDATGQPAIQYNAGRTVVGAFIQALGTAVLAVLCLLLLLLRNLRQTLAIIVPLLLATTATAAIATLINQPFNFANIITLPLLIGVGVDNGIHMVKRYQQQDPHNVLMASSTARAILFSTLTTICSFGTLAFSNHPGTASMGVILAIGMSASLLAALFVVPAMLPANSR